MAKYRDDFSMILESVRFGSFKSHAFNQQWLIKK